MVYLICEDCKVFVREGYLEYKDAILFRNEHKHHTFKESKFKKDFIGCKNVNKKYKTVYIAKSGKNYHGRMSCGHLSRTRTFIKMKEEEVSKNIYTKCWVKGCFPDMYDMSMGMKIFLILFVTSAIWIPLLFLLIDYIMVQITGLGGFTFKP